MKQTVPKNHKQGLYITNGVILQPHEQKTVNFLLASEYDVELIPLSQKEGEHTADIKMCGVAWEMKAPKGEEKWVIKNTIQHASHQAENIIIDLFRIKVYERRCLSELQRYFNMSKRIKRMKVITKSRKILEFSK